MARKAGQTPEYQKLYIDLYRQIAKNKWPPGELLPSESVLQTQYRLTQPVIRQALALLVKSGLVRKQQGKGSIVERRPYGVGMRSIQDGRIYTSQSDAKEIATKILGQITAAPWPAGAFTFAVSAEDARHEAIRIKRLRTVKGIPVFVETIYLANKEIPGLLSLKLENASFYEKIAGKYSICAQSSEQIFWAEAADKETAGLLSLKKGTPVQRVERKVTTNRKDFFIYSTLVADTRNFILFTNS
jgi:DNA-binding GntR family transcriptional regulator